MPDKDRIEVMMAIGNHDEQTGTAVSDISAALILADKSDVHRDRVVNKNIATFSSTVTYMLPTKPHFSRNIAHKSWKFLLVKRN